MNCLKTLSSPQQGGKYNNWIFLICVFEDLHFIPLVFNTAFWHLQTLLSARHVLF